MVPKLQCDAMQKARVISDHDGHSCACHDACFRTRSNVTPAEHTCRTHHSRSAISVSDCVTNRDEEDDDEDEDNEDEDDDDDDS